LSERLRERLIPIAFCVGGLLLAHHEMILGLGRYIPEAQAGRWFGFTQNDLGDTRFTQLLMEHAWRWLIGDPMHHDFWSPPYFYPQTGHIVWNENMLGAAPLYFPFRVLGLQSDDAYMGWILATGALNFVATFFLLRRAFGFTTVASSVGAVMFAFSASRINQTMHWQLFPHYFTAWAAHAAYRLANASQLTERQRVWWIAALAASTVGQLWASIYLGWFLIFVFVVGVALGLCWTKMRAELWGLLKSNPWTLAITAALSVAALYPLGWRYLATAGQFGGRPFDEVLTMLPMPHVWLHMGAGSWFYGWLAKWPAFQRIPMEHEQRIGFGLIATGVSLLTFWRFRKEPRLIYVGVLLLILVATTTLYSADGFSPWRIVHAYFPGAQAIRAVARAAQVYMLGIAIACAAFVSWLEGQQKWKVAAWALAGVLFFEQGYETPAYSKADNRRDIAEVTKAIEPGCEVFLFSPVQGYGPYWKYQLDAMWAALEAHVPTINGYGGQNPEGWGFTDTNLRGGQDEVRVQQAASSWIQRNPELQKKKLCWARAGFNEAVNMRHPDGSVFAETIYSSEVVSQKVPTSMKAGERADVEVTYKNVGPKPWPMGVGIRLGAETPQDNTQWGMGRVDLPAETPVGATATFRFSIVAPPQPGQHAFQWRMVHDGMMWFGPMSTMQLIDVQPAPEPPPEQSSSAPDAGG
jgi:hypothetical protein